MAILETLLFGEDSPIHQNIPPPFLQQPVIIEQSKNGAFCKIERKENHLWLSVILEEPDPDDEEYSEEVFQWRVRQSVLRRDQITGLVSEYLVTYTCDKSGLYTGETDGRHYCWYALSSDTLQSLEQTPFGAVHLLRLVHNTCSGLAAYHEAGLVHRAVRPDRVFLNKNTRSWQLGCMDPCCHIRLYAEEQADPTPPQEDIRMLGELFQELLKSPQFDEVPRRQRRLVRRIAAGCLQPEPSFWFRSVRRILQYFLLWRVVWVLSATAVAVPAAVALGCFLLKPPAAEPAPPEIPDTPAVTTETKPETPLPTDITAEYGGNTYSLIAQPLPWEDARLQCELLGGTLVCVGSVEEHTFLYELVQQSGAEEVWLGGYYDPEEESWQWLDGSPFGYTGWADTQSTGEAICLRAEDGAWLPVSPDTDRRVFICEWQN